MTKLTGRYGSQRKQRRASLRNLEKARQFRWRLPKPEKLEDVLARLDARGRCCICGKIASAAAGPANEPICAECEAEMMVELP